MTEPLICSEGKYCPAGSDQEYDCPVGTFSDLRGLTDISECQVGAYGKYYD